MLKCYPKYKPILHTVSKGIPPFLTVPPRFLFVNDPTNKHPLTRKNVGLCVVANKMYLISVKAQMCDATTKIIAIPRAQSKY